MGRRGGTRRSGRTGHCCVGTRTMALGCCSTGIGWARGSIPSSPSSMSVELRRATVTVTTLGEGAEAEFLRDVEGACVVEDFPSPGETVTLEWQQNTQNFVMTRGTRPAGENRAGVAGVGYLENPGPNSFQSGIGLISGWVCEADEVEIAIGVAGRQVAAYGTERLDTETVCGDTDNGFGLLFNWNRLGDREHEVVAYADGVELGRATVRVTTLGAEFLRDAEGECVVDGLPDGRPDHHPGVAADQPEFCDYGHGVEAARGWDSPRFSRRRSVCTTGQKIGIRSCISCDGGGNGSSCSPSSFSFCSTSNAALPASRGNPAGSTESPIAPGSRKAHLRLEQITMLCSASLSSLRSVGFQPAWRPGWPPSQAGSYCMKFNGLPAISGCRLRRYSSGLATSSTSHSISRS